MSGPHRLFAAAIFGPPLPRLVLSIFSHEFELSTMCHRLFIDISVSDGHHYPTKYTLVLQVVTLTDTEYKPRSSLHEHAKGHGLLS